LIALIKIVHIPGRWVGELLPACFFKPACNPLFQYPARSDTSRCALIKISDW
jgi:hypothetical protein